MTSVHWRFVALVLAMIPWAGLLGVVIWIFRRWRICVSFVKEEIPARGDKARGGDATP